MYIPNEHSNCLFLIRTKLLIECKHTYIFATNIIFLVNLKSGPLDYDVAASGNPTAVVIWLKPSLALEPGACRMRLELGGIQLKIFFQGGSEHRLLFINGSEIMVAILMKLGYRYGVPFLRGC